MSQPRILNQHESQAAWSEKQPQMRGHIARKQAPHSEQSGLTIFTELNVLRKFDHDVSSGFMYSGTKITKMLYPYKDYHSSGTIYCYHKPDP
jgi:hypothetical protein